jgi:anti-sigma factor RsiW
MGLFQKDRKRTEHKEVEQQVSAYLDGELSSQERRVVEHHLDTCEACQWNLETLRQTVQWTQELPTVQVPRVFTIRAPAEPARKARRRWNFLPVLQGATALVALLLIFAVAGDFMLTGLLPTRAPESQVVGEQKATEAGRAQEDTAEATQVLEMEAAAPPAAEAEAVVEKPVSEPSPSPEPQIAPTEAVHEEQPEAIVATVTPEIEGMRAVGSEPPAEEVKEAKSGATKAPRALVPTPVPTETYSTTDEVRPTPTQLPTASPEATAVAAPTVLAEAPEPVAVEPEDKDWSLLGAYRAPAADWLRVAEFVLGPAFILLAITTIVVMVRRRRTK